MGKKSSSETLRDIIEAVDREPKSIQEIADETGRERATVSKYLSVLSETQLIKQSQVGRQKVFWRYLTSDRQAGLELRGSAYQLGKLQSNLKEAKETIEQLIEKSADSTLLDDFEAVEDE